MPNHNDMAFLGSSISQNMAKTPEGFLICYDVPIARLGVQEYYGQEIGIASRVNLKTKVYRLADDVFDEQALRSFEGKPVVDDHPQEGFVTPENHQRVSKGHLQNIRTKGEYVIADLMIKDADLIKKIESGKREVSAGYSCNYQPYQDGYRQVNITANHVAVVDKGRAGPKVRINDKKSVLSKNGAKKPMKTKEQAMKKMFTSWVKDAEPDEIAEMLEIMNDSAPAEKPEVKTDSGKAEKGLFKALLGLAFAKDEDSEKPKEKAETEDEDEDSDKPKETKDSKLPAAIEARISGLEKTMDSIAKALNITADEDSDDDEDKKNKAEDEDEDESKATEEEQKANDAAILKGVMDSMKPFLATLPEAQRKQAKDALRKQLRGGKAATVYGAIARSAAKAAQVNDAEAIDWGAYSKEIMAKNNIQLKKA